jgi:hypothetical protein
MKSNPRLVGFYRMIKVFTSARHQVLSCHVITCSFLEQSAWFSVVCLYKVEVAEVETKI